MIARIRRWLSSHRFVEVDDVVIVPLDKWHQVIGERDRLRLECERLRALVREGV
jgi:mannose-6-phosphate isomerase-like protein (cupin superfamily)